MKPSRLKNYERNMSILNMKNVVYVLANHGMAVLVRDGVIADFYPSTNKWVCGGKVFQGDAEKFILFISANKTETKKVFRATPGLKVKVSRPKTEK
jgi:hypothetical protein